MGELEVIYSVHAFYLWLGLVALVLLLALWLVVLQQRLGRALRHYQQLAAGVDGQNLQDALERQVGLVQETLARVDTLDEECRHLDTRLQKAVQKVGIVRFNPFGDTGGDQSFSIALLDAYDNGVVLSSLFSRLETRVFAKAVQSGQSKYVLSEEERDAIDVAGADGSERTPKPQPVPERSGRF